MTENPWPAVAAMWAGVGLLVLLAWRVWRRKR